MIVWKLLFLVVCTALNAALQSDAAENVTIEYGNTLKQYLCPSNGSVPPNTTLVLSVPEMTIRHDEGDLFCLVENTINLAIIPSLEVLGAGSMYVTVSCVGTIGFGFFNVTSLTIRSVVFRNCGASISTKAVKFVNETSQFLYYDGDSDVSLFLSHCYHLKLTNVSVGGNAGLVVGVNLCGASEITSLFPDGDADYPLSKMLIYFTDSDLLTPPVLECSLAITSNVIISRKTVQPLDYDIRNNSIERILIDSIHSEFALFLTQSLFVANVSLMVGPQKGQYYPTYVFIKFVNSMTLSHVTFQGLGLPYLHHCFNEEYVVPYEGAIQLEVVFYETPSFMRDGAKDREVLSPISIQNTSFARAIIEKLSGVLSHEVTLENVSWCENRVRTRFFGLAYMMLLRTYNDAFTECSGVGRLYLKISNAVMHHNFVIDDSQLKQSPVGLMHFHETEATITGTSYFAENTRQTVIGAEGSNITIGGNLTIKDGYAFVGGGIRLDSSSFLLLKEPLFGVFKNNTADQGSAIYAPGSNYQPGMQILLSDKYSLSNITSVNVSLEIENNGTKDFPTSLYAPLFNGISLKYYPQSILNVSFDSLTWDSDDSQYAYTTLIDTVFHMEERDKFTSLSNGLCIQLHWQDWECGYYDHSNHDRTGSPCQNPSIPYHTTVYPGQKAFSVRYYNKHVLEMVYCRHEPGHTVEYYKNWTSSLVKDNSTWMFTLQHYGSSFDEDGYYVVLFSDLEVHIILVPILQLTMTSCPVGFCLSKGSCLCHGDLGEHGYSCNIDGLSFATNDSGYWTGLSRYHDRILFDDNCPPNYCMELGDFHLDDTLAEASCLGNRTGVLCGECKENYSVVFGSDTCCSHCTDVYLLTLPVYALAGLLLVLLLFVLRLTVATGTINGVIFYANMLGLVMDKLTEHMSGGYIMFVRVFISLLNLDLGFPLCLYEGMTTAGKVGFQFVFPVYLWSVVIVLILLAKRSKKVAKAISKSSVQVLATLFYLSFSKLLRTVIVIFSPSTVHVIEGCGNSTTKHVWFFDGQDYGNSTHAILLTFAVVFTLLFLIPFALSVTFSSYLLRYNVVNKYFKNYVDAYGGPFRDQWRFWFGLRLWITIVLFGLDGFLQGTNSNTMFVVHVVVIMVFLLLQGIVRPYKSNFVGLLDVSFIAIYWLLIESYLNLSTVFYGSYIFLTAVSVIIMCLILLVHLLESYSGPSPLSLLQENSQGTCTKLVCFCVEKYQEIVTNVFPRPSREGYETISGDSDEALFNTAEDREG